ncbi:SBBP repeat-containing protein [Myxococcota bacterium]|nr:SBBP repeat-containing protein [Myxococcota bacterium]
MKLLPFLFTFSFIFISLSCDEKTGTSQTCGDGVLDVGEACETGNFGGSSCQDYGFYGGDLTCSDQCVIQTEGCVESCGDNIVQESHEECEGLDLSGATCESLGYHGTGLKCTDGCLYDTTLCEENGRCGDGTVQAAFEECEGLDLQDQDCDSLGYNGGTLSCNSDCTFNESQCENSGVCGDGEVNGGFEECDGIALNNESCSSLGYHGGTLSCGDDCLFDTSSCEAFGQCGDGEIQTAYEQCEGLALQGESCTSLGYHGGTLNCGSDCMYDLSQCEDQGACMDGTIQPTYEDCEGSNLGGSTCQSLGYNAGTLSCNSDCTFNLSSCESTGQCGDGMLQSTYEECDGGELNGYTCGTLPEHFYGGVLSCTTSCEFDTTSCEAAGFCGDNTWQASEECDGGDMHSETCTNNGFYSGTVSCASNCTVNTSNCTGYCGDNTIQSPQEECDGSALNGATCPSRSYLWGTLGCSSCNYSEGSCHRGFVWGSSAIDIPTDMAIDSANNVYVVGYTYGSLGGVSNQGASDIFLTKYNASGSLAWTKMWGSSSYDEAYSIDIDTATNSIYLAGKVSSGFNGQTALGNYDAMLMKVNTSGVVQWTKVVGTSSADEYNAVVFYDNYLYVAGFSLGKYSTGTATAGTIVDKFNTSGVRQSGMNKQFQTTSSTDVVDMVVTGTNALYIVGTTTQSLLGQTNNGGSDIMLIYWYLSNPTPNWLKLYGTSANESGTQIIKYAGDLLIGGKTAGSLFGTTAGGDDAVLFRVDLSSPYSTLWGKQFGTPNSEHTLTLTSDSAQNIYGAFSVLGAYNGHTTYGQYDLAIVKLNGAGTVQWDKQVGSSAPDVAMRIAKDGLGRILVIGMTTGAFDGLGPYGNYDSLLYSVEDAP